MKTKQNDKCDYAGKEYLDVHRWLCEIKKENVQLTSHNGRQMNM